MALSRPVIEERAAAVALIRGTIEAARSECTAESYMLLAPLELLAKAIERGLHREENPLVRLARLRDRARRQSDRDAGSLRGGAADAADVALDAVRGVDPGRDTARDEARALAEASEEAPGGPARDGTAHTGGCTR